MLAAGSSCPISLSYTAVTQQDSDQLAIVADPSQTRYTVYLNGVGSSSALAVSTPTVEFGSQFVGSSPLGRMVNTTNTTPYTTSAPGVSTSSEFAQTNTCTTALAPQASCRVPLTYSPVTNEIATGTLIASGFGPGGSQNVNLYASGLIVSSLAFSPMPLTLYGVLNEPPSPAVLTLTNTSQTLLKLLSFQVSGPFSQTSKCPARLAPAASCSVTITFKPTQAGTFNGSLSISNSGANSPQVAPLVGPPQTVLSITPTLVDFGQQLLHEKFPGFFW